MPATEMRMFLVFLDLDGSLPRVNETILREGFSFLLFFVHGFHGKERIFVGERAGLVYILSANTLQALCPREFLRIKAQIRVD